MSIQLRTRYRARRILLGFGGALFILSLSSAALFTATTFIVNAFTSQDRIGPNPVWYNNSARFALENDTNVAGSTDINIPVFIKNTGSSDTPEQFPPTNVSIRAFDWTRGYIGNTPSAVSFTYRTNYSLITNACSNVSTSYAGEGSSDRNFTIDRRCFTYRADIDAWYTTIKAHLQNSTGSIQFRTQITAPILGNELFGYDATTSRFAIAARYRCDSGGNVSGCGNYYNYSVPFGTPCSEVASKSVAAHIYDPDNPSGSDNFGIQPQAFSVSVYDVTAGAPIAVSKSGTSGNGGQLDYQFTVLPSHKYQFRVNHVYTNNVLQFKLPYSSIESIANCAWGLTPDVSLNVEEIETPTNSVDVNHTVTNGGPGGSANTNWQLTRCRVPASAGSGAYATVADNTSNGVNTYNALGGTCAEVTSGTTTFPEGTKVLGPLTNQSIGDEPVGTRICYILSVNPPSDLAGASTWRHSTPKCILVVKKPKVQILGNDLIVGKNNLGEADVETSLSRLNINGTNKTYGSWVEYAIAASGTVTNAGSGAGYAGGNAGTSFCNVSLLTFINTPAESAVCTDQDGGVGHYAIEKSLPDVGARLSGGSSLGANPTIDIRTLAKGTYTASGNVSITNSNGAEVPKGKWVIINAAGATVTIKSNLRYTTDPLSTAADIPQVIIIADKINIQGAVTNIDAWLIARGTNGTINTCSEVGIGQPLTDQACASQLVVNGPVISEKLYLYRTGGSGSGNQAGVPAEKFNLRPDAYLWATEWMSSIGRLQTVYTRELPPRF